MKKYILSAVLLLLSTLLSACGAKAAETQQESESTWQGMTPEDDLTAIAERTEYYDLTVQSESLFDLGLWEQNPQEQNIQVTIAQGGTVYLPLAAQFLEGEPVQLWTEASSTVSNVWLYRKDGSRELLLQDVPGQYSRYNSSASRYRWYMDRSGDFYCYGTFYSTANGEDRAVGSIVKILSSGEILYENTLESGLGIDNLCQTAGYTCCCRTRKEIPFCWQNWIPQPEHLLQKLNGNSRLNDITRLTLALSALLLL